MRLPRISLHFLLLTAFSLFALAPLTAPGYFSNAHDARHSVYFLQMFDQAMRDGAWYPRWAADMTFGYGYPLWNFYPPLGTFLGQAIHLIGFDFVSAVKMVDGLALYFSALAMYLFASRVMSKNAALVAAIAYLYIPYHLVDLYVRATQAELLAFIFPPLVCWGLHRLAQNPNARDAAFVALAYTGLLLSHTSTAVIFTPVIGLYALFLAAQTIHHSTNHPATQPPNHLLRALRFPLPAFRFTLYGFLAALLALALSAAFLFPILAEQRYLTQEPLIGGFFNYQKHFVNLTQLLSPFWGYGYAGGDGSFQFSVQLGLIPLFLALIGVWAIPRAREALRNHTAFFSVVLALAIFAMLPVSVGTWQALESVVAFVQFPWRILSVAAFALAFLAGAALDALGWKAAALPSNALLRLAQDGWATTPLNDARGSAIALVLILVTASFPYTLPQHTEAAFNSAAQMEFEVTGRELLGDTIWMSGERPQDSPLVAQYRSGAPLEKAIVLDGNAQVETTRHGGQSDELRVVATTSAQILVYTRYFPGWSATLDGQPLSIAPFGEQGLILLTVPAGEHRVRLRFEDTPPRALGALISTLGVLIALALIAKKT